MSPWLVVLRYCSFTSSIPEVLDDSLILKRSTFFIFVSITLVARPVTNADKVLLTSKTSVGEGDGCA